MGLVFLEAMAFGLPIVATAIGGIPDMVTPGKNGLLIQPGDVAGLTEHLARLLNNSELRAQYGAVGRALALEHYNWEKTGERIYQTITKHVNL